MPSPEELLARIEALEKRQEHILRTLWSIRADFKGAYLRIEKELGADFHELMKNDAEKVTKVPECATETYTIR